MIPSALKKSWLVLPVLLGLFSGTASTRAQSVTVAPPEVSAAVVSMPLVLDQLRSGALSVEDAEKGGLLSADSLLYAIGKTVSKPDTELRHALVELLVTRYPERLQKPSALTFQVRVEVAKYFGSIGDARADDWYQSLQSDLKALPAHPADLAGVGLALGSLAQYYEGRGDYQQALALVTQSQSYSSQPDAGSLIEEARIYQALGESSKADEAYGRIPESASGWTKGMALYDRASTLIAQGKQEEARKLLKSPVTGKNADQMQIGMLALLGYSYLQTQEFEQARRYSQQAITRYETLKNPLQGEGLQEIVEAARNRLQMLDAWKDKSFEVPLKNLLATRGDDGVYHARLYIHSLTDQQIAVKFEGNAAQLVAVTQQSRKRTDSGVVVTIYDVAYRVAAHPAKLKAQVSTAGNPHEQEAVEIHPQDEDGNE